jgi:parvulin-like peptidyl-prolyl isomerase
MIELELLAQEARRRGLDKQPETQERLRQMLRDELFRELRRTVRSPAEIPESDVRRYYEEHRADFNEPERRRVAHIAVGNRKVAEQVLEKARAALAPTAAGGSGGTQNGALWGKLVAEYSLDRPASSLGALPSELAGDLGIVGPPGHPRGGNPRVPEALRAAVFRVGEVGGVLDEIVPESGKFHVVRLTGRTPARERRFEEAERTIRVALVQEEIRRREAELEQELRKKYPVTIDATGLAAVKAPRADGDDGAPPRERR